jgi:hypothetical protein
MLDVWQNELISRHHDKGGDDQHKRGDAKQSLLSHCAVQGEHDSGKCDDSTKHLARTPLHNRYILTRKTHGWQSPAQIHRFSPMERVFLIISYRRCGLYRLILIFRRFRRSDRGWFQVGTQRNER